MQSPEPQSIIAKEGRQARLREADVQQFITQARQQRSRFIMAKLYTLIQGMMSKKSNRKLQPRPARKPL